ncbi:MAG TPA: acetolactate synthase small subunit [Nevskiaceae bacterium]|nr:acetolactate synthase small subunit [Nevskiaceae bacterium]
MRHIISILLQNEAGALARVSGMFASRGYNIESLSVAPTTDAVVSRVTLAAAGSAAVMDQLVKQLGKMVDVVQVVDYAGREHIECELVMAKVHVEGESARDVVECVRRHRGQVLDEADHLRTVQLTGTSAEVDAFLDELGQAGTLAEVVRTGGVALERGAAVLKVPPRVLSP